MLIVLVCRDPFDHSMMGTVGLPLPGVDLRLEAVPELGYLPSDKKAPRGEVSVGGFIHCFNIRTCMLLSARVQIEAGFKRGTYPATHKHTRVRRVSVVACIVWNCGHAHCWSQHLCAVQIVDCG
jgi:hypothetical protein